MPPHVGFLGRNELCISPVRSRSPAVVSASVGSILSDMNKRPPCAHEVTNATGFQTRGAMTSLEQEGRWALAGAYPEVDSHFLRHKKYFFQDGNVTFLVGSILYCIHQYFLYRDSVYFATRFAQLGVLDHQALPSIIPLEDIECRDFEALLSVLYPENFGEHNLTYDKWVSVLHLSTRWGFASIRKLALASINPPTPYDRLLLARTYSVDHWVIPALCALCERTAPLSLDEARNMKIEDVVLVATVREDIHNIKLRVDVAATPPSGHSSFEGVKVPPVVENCGSTVPEPSSSMSTAPNPVSRGNVPAEETAATTLEQGRGGVDDTDKCDRELVTDGKLQGEFGIQTEEQLAILQVMRQNPQEGGTCRCAICMRTRPFILPFSPKEMEAKRVT